MTPLEGSGYFRPRVLYVYMHAEFSFSFSASDTLHIRKVWSWLCEEPSCVLLQCRVNYCPDGFSSSPHVIPELFVRRRCFLSLSLSFSLSLIASKLVS